MTYTFGQLPRRNPPVGKKATASSGSLIAFFLLLGFASVPRLFILGFWIFSSGLGDAFTNWIIPAAGFFIAPWTTLLYAWMWAISSDAVHGWEWLAVVIGLLLDLWFVAVAARLAR